jgi:hypothetical protein
MGMDSFWTIFQELIWNQSYVRLLNLQLQSQRYSRLERFYIGENIFIIKTRYAIRCVVNFYKAGVVNHNRKIGSGGEFFM